MTKLNVYFLSVCGWSTAETKNKLEATKTSGSQCDIWSYQSKLNGRDTSSTKLQDGHLPNEINMKLPENVEDQWWTAENTITHDSDLRSSGFYRCNKGTFAPEISEMAVLKVSPTNKRQETLQWWFSLWSWIHYDRTDGLRILTSF